MTFFKEEWGLFSAIALLAWIPFGLWLFAKQRPTRAAAHVMIWGMMWLPEAAEFDFPALPPFDKYTICATVAFVGLWWKAPKRLKVTRVGRGLDWFILLAIAGQALTVYGNPEALRYGSAKIIDLPPYTAYDALSTSIRLLLSVAVPCWLGRALLRSHRDLLDVLEILVAAGLVYSIPILYEIRMSPALHWNIYGFNPRWDFSQNMRMGGFRSTAFMGHGLIVGFFVFLCTTAAVALRQAGQRRMFGMPSWAVIGYLFVILAVCKAFAALIYGVFSYALLRWVNVRNQMRALVLLAAIVALYPVSRMFGVFPVQGVLSAAQALGPDRVQSMQFRFDNEDLLLVKGAEKLWFGWGGFGRDRVYDPYNGKDLVVQDGHWIAVFGQQGLLGFLCYFALILIPVVRTAFVLRRLCNPSDRYLVAGLATIVTMCSVNMLPNMALPNLQLFLASGLLVLIR